MNVLVIGDPHGNLKKIKKISLDDVKLILLTGDLGSASLMRKMAFENIERKKNGLPEKNFSAKQKKIAFMEAYNSSLEVVRYLAKNAPVYTIYGNVESTNSETREYSRELGLSLPFLTDALKKIKWVKVINDTLVNFNGIKIGGLAYFVDDIWVTSFKPADYQNRLKSAKKQTAHARKVLKLFGKVDILIHHQPPFKILDKVGKHAPKHWRGKHAGSKVILDYIKRQQPEYSFCGHIHEGEGKVKVGKTNIYNLGVAGSKVITL